MYSTLKEDLIYCYFLFFTSFLVYVKSGYMIVLINFGLLFDLSQTLCLLHCAFRLFKVTMLLIFKLEFIKSCAILYCNKILFSKVEPCFDLSHTFFALSSKPRAILKVTTALLNPSYYSYVKSLYFCLWLW